MGYLVHSGGVSTDILDRKTEPEDPGKDGDGAFEAALSHAFYSLGYGEQWAEDRTNHNSALTFSAVWACVRLISQTIASLGWHQYERAGIKKVEIEDDITWLMQMQASPEMTAFDWRQVMMKDALTWGNGYSEIERDGFGRLKWMWRIDPSMVCVERDDSGTLIYTIKNVKGDVIAVLFADEVFHLKGLGPDGIVGYSVIEMARRSLDMAGAQEKFGSQFFGKGTMPGGILKTGTGRLDEKQRDALRKSFERVYGGAANAGRVVVLSGGQEFTPLSLPNSDSQYIESKQFSIEEVCRWFGVQPHKIADLRQSTNNNIEQQAIEFVQDCLLPWARRLESEADVKFFGTIRRGKRFTRLNLSTLLRGDSAAQTAAVTQRVNAGLITLDEGRAYFDMNPYPDGIGDNPLVQGAMVPLEQALEPPPPPPAPAPMPNQNPPQQDQKTPPSDMLIQAFQPILMEAYCRLLRVEADKAKRAANKGKLAEHVVEFYGKTNVEYIAATLRPIHEAFAAAIGASSPLKVTMISAHAHDEESRSILSRGIEEFDISEERVTISARDDLDRLCDLAGVPPANVTVNVVTVQPQQITVQAAELPAPPDITVNVGAAEAPIVNITQPNITVEAPEPAVVNNAVTVVHPAVEVEEEFGRDARGLITSRKTKRSLAE